MGLIVFNLEGKKERMNDFLQGLEQNITPPPPPKKKNFKHALQNKIDLVSLLALVNFIIVFVFCCLFPLLLVFVA